MPESRIGVVDGKEIRYYSDTEFLVQVGKGRGKYHTKYTIKGNLGEAFFWYKGINIGNGFKKRLLMPERHSPVLTRIVG